jgi:hypothetical protein
MADVTTEDLEVEELVAHEAHTEEAHADEPHNDEAHAEEGHTDPALPSSGWPCQQRRKGRSAELPAPQRYLDLPIWMSAPARRRDAEEETV